MAIQTADKNSVVVIEVNRTKDNTEIVGWRFADAKKLEQLKRQAEREGGQFLIQTSEDAAAALSALPSNLSSEGEGTEKKGTSKGKGEKNAAAKSAEEAGKGYSVEPARYETKRGKTLDMQLLKFEDGLSGRRWRGFRRAWRRR